MRSVGLREAPEPRGEVELWAVRLDGPATRLFCDLPEKMALVRSLYGMGTQGWSLAPAGTGGVELLTLGAPLERIVADEGDMRGLMSCLRRNGHHGSYRKAGDEREYGF